MPGQSVLGISQVAFAIPHLFDGGEGGLGQKKPQYVISLDQHGVRRSNPG
jgi:hypothetical protein